MKRPYIRNKPKQLRVWAILAADGTIDPLKIAWTRLSLVVRHPLCHGERTTRVTITAIS